MGGNILELPSDRIKKAWQDGSEEALLKGVADGAIKPEYAAGELDYTVHEVLERSERYKKTKSCKKVGSVTTV